MEALHSPPFSAGKQMFECPPVPLWGGRCCEHLFCKWPLSGAFGAAQPHEFWAASEVQAENADFFLLLLLLFFPSC